MDFINPVELLEGMYFRKMGTKNGDVKRIVGNGKSLPYHVFGCATVFSVTFQTLLALCTTAVCRK
jgi:hypothetical protein